MIGMNGPMQSIIISFSVRSVPSAVHVMKRVKLPVFFFFFMIKIRMGSIVPYVSTCSCPVNRFNQESTMDK